MGSWDELTILCVVSYFVFLFNMYMYSSFRYRNEKVSVKHFIIYLSTCYQIPVFMICGSEAKKKKRRGREDGESNAK